MNTDWRDLYCEGCCLEWLAYFIRYPREDKIYNESFTKMMTRITPQPSRGLYLACFWFMIAFVIWNSNLVLLLEGLCSPNPLRFELSIFEFLPESNQWPRDRQFRALTILASFTSSRMEFQGAGGRGPLQHTAIHCPSNTLQHTLPLQHTATHCFRNTLQHTLL